MRLIVYIIVFVLMIAFASATTEKKNIDTQLELSVTDDGNCEFTVKTEEWNNTFDCDGNHSWSRDIEFDRTFEFQAEEVKFLETCQAVVDGQNGLLAKIGEGFDFGQKYADTRDAHGRVIVSYENCQTRVKELNQSLSDCDTAKTSLQQSEATITQLNGDIGVCRNELTTKSGDLETTSSKLGERLIIGLAVGYFGAGWLKRKEEGESEEARQFD